MRAIGVNRYALDQALQDLRRLAAHSFVVEGLAQGRNLLLEASEQGWMRQDLGDRLRVRTLGDLERQRRLFLLALGNHLHECIADETGEQVLAEADQFTFHLHETLLDLVLLAAFVLSKAAHLFAVFCDKDFGMGFRQQTALQDREGAVFQGGLVDGYCAADIGRIVPEIDGSPPMPSH